MDSGDIKEGPIRTPGSGEKYAVLRGVCKSFGIKITRTFSGYKGLLLFSLIIVSSRNLDEKKRFYRYVEEMIPCHIQK